MRRRRYPPGWVCTLRQERNIGAVLL